MPDLGRTCATIPARRAKATIAPPPSQQNVLADVMTPPSAAAIEARSNFGSTASVVAPRRSRASITCDDDRDLLRGSPVGRNAASLAGSKTPLAKLRIKVVGAGRGHGRGYQPRERAEPSVLVLFAVSTPPGIRVTYHGGSIGLSVWRDIESGETK